jgi:MFS transporter, PAT family, beta-lactamase induction signal transducer AmpG
VNLPIAFPLLNNRRIGLMLPLGFSSGLPLALTAGTLQAWLTVAGVDLRMIGLFTLVGLPYTLKFLWAPLMDRFMPPWLGRRRGWMIATQTSLIGGVVAMALTNPSEAPHLLGGFALLVAFLSASQDIVFDAYRTDLLNPSERGFGVAFWVMGYRIALLVAGSFALIISEYIGWTQTYILMASLMVIGVVTILVSPEPASPAELPQSLNEAVWGPVRELFSRSAAIGFLLFIMLYKIGDAFAGALATAFLIGGVGFSSADVGIMKALGLAATILGGFAGAMVMAKLGLFRSLLVFGILQAVSNLSFMALAWTGKSYPMMIVAVVLENLTGGMGTAAFVAFVMSLCDHRFTATQFALLSSMEALGRVLLGRPSADLVEAVGWIIFFFMTFLAALPGLWLLWRLRADFSHYNPYDRRRGNPQAEPV